MSVCLCAPSQSPHLRRSNKFLVEGCIANFGLRLHNYFSFGFMIFGSFSFLCFWSHPTVDKPTVDNGGVRLRRGGSVAVAIIVSEKVKYKKGLQSA